MPRSTSHHPRFDYQDYATRLLINRAQFEDDDLKRRIDAFYEHESYEDGSAISDAEEDGEELRKLQEELLNSRSFQWANQVVAKLLEKANSADILERLSSPISPIVLEADLTEERLEELSREDLEKSWDAAIDAANDIVNAFYVDRATNTKQEPIQDAPENVFKIGRVTVTKQDGGYTYEVPRNFTGVIADPKGDEPFATDFRIYYQGALVCIVPALDVIGLSAAEREQAFAEARSNALTRQQKERDHELARRLQEEADRAVAARRAQEEADRAEAARRAKPPLRPELQKYVNALNEAFRNRDDLQGFSNDELNTIVEITTLTPNAKESILKALQEKGWKGISSKDIDGVIEAAEHELALRQALTPEGLEQIRDVLRSVVEGNKVNVDLSEVPALIESLDTISSLDHRTQGYLSRSVGCNPVKFNELLNDVRGQLGAIQQNAALEQQRAREAARKAEEDAAAQAAAEAARQELQPVVDAVNQWEDTSSEDKPSLSDETLVTLAQISGKTDDDKRAILDAVNEDRKTRREGPLTKEDLNNISDEANTALEGKNQSSLCKVINENNITYAQLASGTVPEGREQEVAEMLADLDAVKEIMARGDFTKVTAQHLAALQKMCGRVGIDNPNATLFAKIKEELDSQQPSEGQEPAVEGELASKFWEVFSRTHFLEQYKDAVRGKYGDKVQATAIYVRAAGGAKEQGAKASDRGAQVHESRDYTDDLETYLKNALGLTSENFPEELLKVPYLKILSDIGHPVKGAAETVHAITGNQLQSARQAESKESELTRALRGRASSVASANPGDQTTPPKRPGSALQRTESGRWV